MITVRWPLIPWRKGCLRPLFCLSPSLALLQHPFICKLMPLPQELVLFCNITGMSLSTLSLLCPWPDCWSGHCSNQSNLPAHTSLTSASWFPCIRSPRCQQDVFSGLWSWILGQHDCWRGCLLLWVLGLSGGQASSSTSSTDYCFNRETMANGRCWCLECPTISQE